jgi:hypothetical protein
MAEVPRGLIGDAENSLQLVGAHSILGFAEKVDTQEPLPKGKVRVVEDRSSGHRELIAAIITVKLLTLYDLRNLVRRTTWAHNRVRPAESFKVLAALLFAAKLLNESAKINGVLHA